MMKTASVITLILVVHVAALSTVGQEETKAQLYLETGHTDLAASVMFSVDGATVVSYGNDRTVKLWNASSGQELDTISAFTWATFSPDGSTIVLTTLSDNHVGLWDVASWRLRQTLTVDGLGLVRFSPDGKTLAISDRSKLILWDVASEKERFSFKHASTQSTVKPRAYVIAVGVNANENPAFDLQFAANDARRFQEVLPQRLAATGDYSEVVPISLISDWELQRGQKVTTKRDATKANFKAVLDLLAGRSVPDEIKRAIPNAEKLAKTTPDDLVLILFSSHGYADQSGNFYFIPYDTGPGACVGFTDSVRRRSISSDELSLWLRDVDVGQMTLIVDACYSTAAIEGSGFKPGPMGSRGLGQLAYDKRMRILTATQADNVAMELPATADGRPINHGLLSYALLEDGLGGNKADFKPQDKTIFMDEWLEYAVADVPKLFAGQASPINENQPQSKPRSARPRLVLLKRELSDPGVCGTGPSAGASRIQEQQPSLFDFTRRKRDVPLVRNR